jgi:hypothetical protein
MGIAAKLQLKPGTTVAVLGLPDDIELDLGDEIHTTTRPNAADAVIAFAINGAALDSKAAAAIDAARDDRLAWIAYPKAGKLDTDLNRDVLARLAQQRGIQPVRQISLDDTWSALRFRPAT